MQFVIHVSTVVEYDGLVALVLEGKPESAGKWNLPGGHLELGEELIQGAERELREELGFGPAIEGFLGVYTGIGKDHCLNFIFTAHSDRVGFGEVDGAEILEQRWFRIPDIIAMNDNTLLNPLKLRRVLTDYTSRSPYSLESIGEQLYAFESAGTQVPNVISAQPFR